jgi:hypothetical protein
MGGVVFVGLFRVGVYAVLTYFGVLTFFHGFLEYVYFILSWLRYIWNTVTGVLKKVLASMIAYLQASHALHSSNDAT